MNNLKITRFDGPNSFLSNFFIEPDGTHVEGEYQASKVADGLGTFLFEGLTPAQAKRRGQTIRLRPNWEQIKLDIMRELVAHKFADHPNLASRLRDTQGVHLEEGNYWGDVYWGVCGGVGENWMGKILMEIRDSMV